METINKEQFDNKVSAEENMVVVFSATWCGPCKMLTPTIDKISPDYEDVKFYKVDIEKDPQLTASTGISAVPTIIYYKAGKPVNKQIGAVSASELKKHIEEFI